jgi:alkylation response protein AidB-like acyl-CoA dehydrogenase
LTIAQLNGTIALAAESVGAAARALEMTVEYVGQRVQFGRVIGSFQSVKHRCADMLVQLEGARSALIAAVNCDGATIDERQRFASLAKVTAADAFYFIASETIHLHGGIGFTWDQPSGVVMSTGAPYSKVFYPPIKMKGLPNERCHYCVLDCKAG